MDERETLLEARACHQEAGDELAGCSSVDGHLAARHLTRAVEGEGQTAPAVVPNLDAECLERIHRALHGASARSLVAVEGDRAEGEGCEGRDEAHDSAGEAAVDRHAALELAGEDLEIVAESPVAWDLGDLRAELPQRLDHQLRVACPERMPKLRRFGGERRQHQLAIREALRTRNLQARVDRR